MLGLITLLLMGVTIYNAVWRLYLSPLAKFPGPKLAAVTLWYEFYFDILKDGGGQYLWEIERMHNVYGKLCEIPISKDSPSEQRKFKLWIVEATLGPIVRINPYELHVNDVQFYEKIYANGHHKRDKYEWQVKSGNSAKAMGFTVNHDLHRVRRAAVDPYFSKRSVLKLESVIGAKIARLCEVIENFRVKREPINLTNFLLATTTDVITEYAFTDCHNLLDSEELSDKWEDTITCVMKNTALINHYGWLPRVMESTPKNIAQLLAIDISMIADLRAVRSPVLPFSHSPHCFVSLLNFNDRQRIKSRLRDFLSSGAIPAKQDDKRHAIFESILSSPGLPAREKDLKRLTDEGAILLIAGSETPAKVLSLILFHLISNPRTLQRLRTELDGATASSANPLGLTQLEQLPYMTAVIKEGLRLHGGITARSQRVAPAEPLHYADWIIPAGTPLSSMSYFIHYNAEIYPAPMMFTPERWLVADMDRLDRYLVAFGRGTRNCVGTNLGMAELYLVLAAVAGRFEMELFQTDRGDVDVWRDWYVPRGRVDSKGVRVCVTGVRDGLDTRSA